MSLVELLAVSTILLLMAGALGSVALNVQDTNEYHVTRGLSLQHGQVTMVRLQRHIRESTANDMFPGFAVFSETVGADVFPDTLVVWHPTASAVDPSGMPRINELIVYCANPSAKNELWEITKPTDTRTAPSLSNLTAWRQELQDFRTATTATRNVITDLLRIGSIRDSNGVTTTTRSVLRFDATQRPSAAQWQSCVLGQTAFSNLPWVLGISGRRTGLCQSQCRFEFHLTPGESHDNNRDAAIPFFGSAAVCFDLTQP